MLVDAGADTTLKNKHGKTALMYAQQCVKDEAELKKLVDILE